MSPRALHCVCAGAAEDRSKRGKPPGNEASDARIRSFTFTLDLSGERWEYLRLLVGFAGDLGISRCFFKILFIYLFLAVLGLHHCMGFSLVAASGGGTVSLQRAGFSLRWPLSLWNTGPRAFRLLSCSS